MIAALLILACIGTALVACWAACAAAGAADEALTHMHEQQ
jgi:hypothetical protein